MKPPLKIGLVGVGTVALRGVIPHLVEPDIQDRARLTALCNPSAPRMRAAAERYGIPQTFGSLNDLLREGDVDIVTIASPIGLHYAQGKAALLAGKHVHFNKTMTTTAAEATELIELARARDLKIVASPGEMLRPHNQETKRLIESGALGTIAWAACGAALDRYHEEEPERRDPASAEAIDPAWYFRKPGGGPLYDMAVYALHALTGILGAAKQVTAMSGVRVPERMFGNRAITTETDDNTLMLLDFGGGLFAMVYGTAAGTLRGHTDFSCAFYGTKGTIDGLFRDGAPFDYSGCALARSAPDGGLDTGLGGNEWLLPHIPGAHRHIDEQHVHEDLMQLVDWVRDGTPSIVTAEHARHVIEIIEAAYRSAETGQHVTLTTTF